MLKSSQKDRLKSVLDPNSKGFYKVLILDETTKNIISPLLRSNDLRELGVVSYFMVHSLRQQICDMPAVYFLSPTSSNLKRLSADICTGDLYGAYFLNFTTTISRSDLEALAISVANRSKGNFVHSISDQFLDFVSLAENLFSLNLSDSLSVYEDPKCVEDTALSLFSVFTTLQQIPYILADSKLPSSSISVLGNSLCEAFRNINIIKKTRKRPLCIIIDRSFDLATPARHGWAYNSLCADILSLRLNKIGSNPEKGFDLADDDAFWQSNQAEPFTAVSANVEQELVSLKKELAEKCIDDRTDQRKMAEVLAGAPGLARRNEAIKGHMTTCLELVQIIRERSLDEFYRIENTRGASIEEIQDVAAKGTDFDAIRLCISLKDRLSQDLLLNILHNRNITKDILEWPVFKTHVDQQEQGMRQRMFTSIVGNVKKLLPVSNEAPIYSHIENIFNNIRAAKELSSLYTIFDPISKKRQFYDSEIDRIVVFVMGAGNYEEFNSLNRLQKKLNIEIVYGSHDIISSTEFVRQMCLKYNTIVKN